MSKNHYDVIVVGAGFSGLTAARELSNRGHKTLILEGRDRMGGRTWVDHRMGKDLEMGGTYVHWFQPHIWAEITRYGLELQEVPTLESAHWITNGELKTGTRDEMFAKINEGMEVFLQDALEYFPRPFDPFFAEDKVKEIDHQSVEDRLKEIESEISQETMDLIRGEWSAYFDTKDLTIPALTQAYRFGALAYNNWYMLEDIFELYKFKNGTKSLIESIYNDGQAELKLSTPVAKIEKTDALHTVTTRDGEEYTAKAVITAIPINVLNDIEFEPRLLEEKHQLSEEKQTTDNGAKLWARVKGLESTALLSGPATLPSGSLHTDTVDGDEGYIMGYVTDIANLDMEKAEDVEKLLRNWLPEIEVLESTGHNWTEDEFSKGTWGILRVNQLSKYGRAVRQSEDGLYLAGSDFADGWAGFMDGAIESGLKTGRRVHEYLTK